jgi:hypothetical protein
MEWALFIKRPEELTWLEKDHTDWQEDRSSDLTSSPADVPGISFSRTYYGAEFSEALIPPPEELERCLFTSLERGLSFTFVTPRVTDHYLEKLKGCFDFLIRASFGTEIVVNDWGVMRLLRKNYNKLLPVLGRLLNRSHKEYEKSNAANLKYFPYRRFLLHYGVKRVEFDCPIQATGINLEKTGLGGSLYFPHDCCVIGGTYHVEDTSMYSIDENTRCSECIKECNNVTDELPQADSSMTGEEVVLPVNGRTPFDASKAAYLEKNLVRVTNSTIDRLIYQISTPA